MSLAATVLAAEGEGGGGFWETAYPILPHPGEMIFGFIAIAILYYVVAKYVVPRLEQVFSERAAAIEGGLRKADLIGRIPGLGGFCLYYPSTLVNCYFHLDHPAAFAFINGNRQADMVSVL